MIKTNQTTLCICIVCAILLNGCSQKKNEPTVAGTAAKPIVYNIKNPTPVSNTERKRITAACELFYDTTLQPSGFNGSIIVAKQGNIIFEKYKGSVNLDGLQPITSSTPLHIASVSKTFTAMAILKLQEEGKLNINDSITHFFPQFNYPGVTIKNLLNHRSGLPNYLYFMEKVGWNTDSLIQNKDVLEWLISKKNSIDDIGPADKKFTYCNTNYALLALIIEKVSGKSYPDFMKATIFDPLKMNNTFVHHTGDGQVRSKSFDWKGREIPDNFLDEVYGDKNIYSTAKDLLIWDRALSDSIFLTGKSLEMAYTPYSNERPGIKNYGLGWRMNIYGPDKKIIFHNGWWHGNNATFIRLLKQQATIIVLSNRFARSVYKSKLLANIFENYFDDSEEDSENIVPTEILKTSSLNTKNTTIKSKPSSKKNN